MLFSFEGFESLARYSMDASCFTTAPAPAGYQGHSPWLACPTYAAQRALWFGNRIATLRAAFAQG